MLSTAISVPVDASVSRVLASSSVEKDPDEIIFVRVPPELKSRWKQMCVDRNIDQTKAGRVLVRWILKQPPTIQALVLGGIEFDASGLTEAVPRLAAKRRGPRGPKQ